MGTLFLFLLLLLTGGVGIYYTAQLKDQAKAVLKDNYESLAYSHVMQEQLDSSFLLSKNVLKTFDSVLEQQKKNVTEPGEREATQKLMKSFGQLKAGDTSSIVIKELRNSIQKVLAVNMKAISRKSQMAENAANTAFSIIMGLAGLLFLISFTFMVNFPSIVTNPINQFIEAIKEIAAKNYKHRINFDRKDEFGKMANAFNEMAERLQYFESSNLNKILFEKSRAEAVINSLKDASIGIDKGKNILFANAEALQLMGVKAIDIVGKPVEEFKCKNDLFRFLMNEENTTPFKIVVNDKENYFTKELINVNQGNTSNQVIVIKNITSFKELDVAKTNFIATISHELKTPLASSDFSLKLLEDDRTGTLSSDQKELVENLKQDNQRILKILSELLNMSQVETGKIQLQIQKVNPSDIIDAAMNTVSSAAREKKISIEINKEPGLPDIDADAEKTTWVLNNFLTNAIKYSPANDIIKMKAVHSNGSIIFLVKDNGPGVDQEYQSRLFERYFQAPGAKAKGSGLGLAISKEFIEAQGGKIWVESEIGSGSTFYFSLKAEV